MTTPTINQNTDSVTKSLEKLSNHFYVGLKKTNLS